MMLFHEGTFTFEWRCYIFERVIFQAVDDFVGRGDPRAPFIHTNNLIQLAVPEALKRAFE
jgi:hypothetical protein